MKLSVLTVVLNSLSLEDTLKFLHERGVQQVELGAGGYTSDKHLQPAMLLEDNGNIAKLKDLLERYDMEISALSCHGNPVHPNVDVANRDNAIYENTVVLAEKLGVETVVTFSGCPGDHDGAKYPNWVTSAWPEDFGKILDYQWNEKLIPYWQKAAKFAEDHGIHKVAFEMHPGFCVYNPETMLRIREAVGPTLGANFDPSHLIWQGMDPVEAIRALKGAIYHFHAKDTRVDPANCAKNGVLDTKNYADIEHRSWSFRTVGYGSDRKLWHDMISMLRTVGYDGAVSIEHEDGLMSPMEGLCKAIEFLKEVLIYEAPGEMWWA